MRSGGGPKCGRKGATEGEKIWKASKDVWKPCNPLKSHKTAKALFGKAWSQTRHFWRSLEKAWEGAFIPPRLLSPPTASDRVGTSLRGAKLRSPGSCRRDRRLRLQHAVP